MRVFQFHSFYRPYLADFYRRNPDVDRVPYREHLQRILDDRFHSLHILEPVYREGTGAAFAVANDIRLQRKWARENGHSCADLASILLAQIRDHRSEVVYSLDPVTFGSSFVEALPSCVRRSICWYAAPGIAPGVEAYDLRVCNFPAFLDGWRRKGLTSTWFSPAVDSLMEEVGKQGTSARPIDVAFAGLYSRYHTARNELLCRVADRLSDFNLQFAFQAPRWRPLFDVRWLRRIPTFVAYLPKCLRNVQRDAAYGASLYRLFGSAKIVINAAVDVAGAERGNMRCFEAMGCGACMVSDEGVYPDGFSPGEDFVTYRGAEDAVEKIIRLLNDPPELGRVARRGRDFMLGSYSKAEQWNHFQEIVGAS